MEERQLLRDIDLCEKVSCMLWRPDRSWRNDESLCVCMYVYVCGGEQEVERTVDDPQQVSIA